MPDEAIGREIRQLREDTQRGLGEIKAGLDKLLPREVYEARHDALVKRVDTLERDFERAEADRDRDRERVEADRTAMRRWLISAVVLPVVSMAVMIILSVT